MKTKQLLTLTIVLIMIQCHAQKPNEIRVYYGIIDSEFLGNNNLDGGTTYDNANTFEFGIRYLRKISNNLFLETGINYLGSEVETTPVFTGTPVNSSFEDLKMVSVPILVNYALGKYFFANGGPLLDFQKDAVSFDSQSGIGYSVGIGVKYSITDFAVYINPNFKQHAFIPFEKENNHQRVTELGVQVGVGYQF